MAKDLSPEELLQLIELTARGESPAPLVKVLERAEPLTLTLIQVAIRAAGPPDARAVCSSHVDDPQWSQWLKLDLQEYGLLFPVDPLVHLRMPHAIEQTSWATRALHGLRRGGEHARLAARRMLVDMDSLAAEAADYVRTLDRFRRRIGPPPTILQVQALVRLERVLGDLRGKRILEVGPDKGGLFRELENQGAKMFGVDLVPLLPNVIKGDFMTADLPGRFDAIVATAVFERGSNVRGEPNPEDTNFSPELLVRFHELLVDGGAVVLENVGLPLPFTKGHAENAGFDLITQRIPSATHEGGGRGVTLRRKSRFQEGLGTRRRTTERRRIKV